MKTKSKRRTQRDWPSDTKPTTLLDVWGTDVERVILEDGNDLLLRTAIARTSFDYCPYAMAMFTPNGEYWCRETETKWKKSADTRVAYVFPPEFKPEPVKLSGTIAAQYPPVSCTVTAVKGGSPITVGQPMTFSANLSSIFEPHKPEKPSPWYVRLDDWLKRLVTRNGAKS